MLLTASWPWLLSLECHDMKHTSHSQTLLVLLKPLLVSAGGTGAVVSHCIGLPCCALSDMHWCYGFLLVSISLCVIPLTSNTCSIGISAILHRCYRIGFCSCDYLPPFHSDHAPFHLRALLPRLQAGKALAKEASHSFKKPAPKPL